MRLRDKKAGGGRAQFSLTLSCTSLHVPKDPLFCNQRVSLNFFVGVREEIMGFAASSRVSLDCPAWTPALSPLTEVPGVTNSWVFYSFICYQKILHHWLRTQLSWVVKVSKPLIFLLPSFWNFVSIIFLLILLVLVKIQLILAYYWHIWKELRVMCMFNLPLLKQCHNDFFASSLQDWASL